MRRVSPKIPNCCKKKTKTFDFQTLTDTNDRGRFDLCLLHSDDAECGLFSAMPINEMFCILPERVQTRV